MPEETYTKLCPMCNAINIVKLGKTDFQCNSCGYKSQKAINPLMQAIEELKKEEESKKKKKPVFNVKKEKKLQY